MRKIMVVFGAMVLSATIAVSTSSADGDLAVAKLLYQKKCSVCHGKDGVPKKRGGESASFNDPEWQAKITVEQIVEIIKEGRGEGKYKMKPLETKLTPEEIEMVARFVKEEFGKKE